MFSYVGLPVLCFFNYKSHIHDISKFAEFRHSCAAAEIDPGKNKNGYRFYITCLRKCSDPEEVVIYPGRETV